MRRVVAMAKVVEELMESFHNVEAHTKNVGPTSTRRWLVGPCQLSVSANPVSVWELAGVLGTT